MFARGFENKDKSTGNTFYSVILSLYGLEDNEKHQEQISKCEQDLRAFDQIIFDKLMSNPKKYLGFDKKFPMETMIDTGAFIPSVIKTVDKKDETKIYKKIQLKVAFDEKKGLFYSTLYPKGKDEELVFNTDTFDSIFGRSRMTYPILRPNIWISAKKFGIKWSLVQADINMPNTGPKVRRVELDSDDENENENEKEKDEPDVQEAQKAPIDISDSSDESEDEDELELSPQKTTAKKTTAKKTTAKKT